MLRTTYNTLCPPPKTTKVKKKMINKNNEFTYLTDGVAMVDQNTIGLQKLQNLSKAIHILSMYKDCMYKCSDARRENTCIIY